MALGLPGRPAPLVAGRHCRACGCRQLPARVSGAACGGLGKPLRAGQRVAPVVRQSGLAPSWRRGCLFLAHELALPFVPLCSVPETG